MLKRLRTFKFWKRFFLITLLSTVLLLVITVAVVYWQQDRIVQHFLSQLNKDYKGEVVITDSHIAPFANFPYISIDLEGVKIYEEKEHTHHSILEIEDVYLGFDLWTILSGKYEVKSIKLTKGFIYLIQHKDGSFNLTNALSSSKETTDTTESEPLHIDLKSVHLKDVDIHKLNESTQIDLDIFVNEAHTNFRSVKGHINIGLDAVFEMNMMQNGDTTFIKHKHFDVDTELDYDGNKNQIEVIPSIVKLENGEFELEGKVDLTGDMPMDLKVHAAKPNFDLIIAFAPEELIPTLESYANKGQVFFEATVKGKSANGHMPAIHVDFGCKEGFIKNNRSEAKLEDMEFSGYFTNGEKRDLSTMEFYLKNFQAKPAAGLFNVNLHVKNFNSPEINLKLNSKFNLDFLASFFNLTNLDDMSGTVGLTMNFHDIIDLSHPEKSIEKLNESYFTELLVENLSFRSTDYHLPIKDINIKATMEGHEAVIKRFDAKVGDSDISITGHINDLPAILHHTDDSLRCDLHIRSKLLDLAALTYNDSTKKAGIDEQITDLRLDLDFLTSAKAITESPNLPVGEFLIRDFHAQLKHYPHELHDFHADLFIKDETIDLVDFTGEIDGSDFHFSGKVDHYELFLKDQVNGDTKFEFDLTSEHLRLEDLFAYKGANYVPEDYRHEDFKNLRFHGRTELHFKNSSLHSIDTYVDKLTCKMQVHDSRFERFNGRIHYEDEHIVVDSLSGQIGRSDLLVNLDYYLGKDPEIRKRDNYFSIVSRQLDLDQLLAYNPPPAGEVKTPEEHEDVFNIFEVPFTDIKAEANIGYLKYHTYRIKNLNTSMRMQENHYIYFDTCTFDAAGGSFDIGGYFNGSNPKEIYFSPELYLDNVDIDQLLIKFENFGQDHLVSENLHGRLTCGIEGKIHMHADMTPILDDSELVMDIQVLNGRLDNYKPLEYVSSYFKDKNLNKVRFDTLQNQFEFKNNKISIPKMTINSSLGFIELWGEQELDDDMNMDFFFRIPLKLIARAGFQKLFKRKKEDIDPDQIDEIEYRDKDKRIAFVSVNLKGTMEDYSVRLKKDKKERKKFRLFRKKKRK